MFTKAPTLAWSLLTISCLLIGTLVGEGQHQLDRVPVFPTIGVAVEVEVSFEPTATVSPTPTPTATPYSGPRGRS